jgi:hypothetical protein
VHLLEDGLLHLLFLFVLEEPQELRQYELDGILLAYDWAEMEYGVGKGI